MKMDVDNYSFDIGPTGAIGEQGSLLLRINRNCPWSRCLFCRAHKGAKFEYRKAEEIKRDIDVIGFLVDEIKMTCRKFGSWGEVYDIAPSMMVRSNPEIYDIGAAGEQTLRSRHS